MGHLNIKFLFLLNMDIETVRRMLQSRINEVNALLESYDNEGMETFLFLTRLWLSRFYGGNSPQLRHFNSLDFESPDEGLVSARALLNGCITLLEEEGLPPMLRHRLETATKRVRNDEVFIVHGHDEKAVKELEEIVVEAGYTPKYLRDFGTGSETLISKLNKATECSYAIIILTPDDWGTEQKKIDEVMNDFKRAVDSGRKIDAVMALTYFDRFISPFKYRARQNVIFELGFFKAELGDEYVAVLLKKHRDIEWDFPSDIHGGYYIEFEDSVYEKEEEIKKSLEILKR